MVDNLDDVKIKISTLEQTLNSLSVDIKSMVSHQKLLSNNVEKITQIFVKQAEYEEKATQNSKDINILYGQIRSINDSGTKKCPVHSSELDYIRESVDVLKENISYRDKLIVKIVVSLVTVGIIAAVTILVRVSGHMG